MEIADRLLSKKSTNVRSEIKRQEALRKTLKRVLGGLAPIVPELTSRAAEQLFFRPQRFTAPKRELQVLDTGHRLQFDLPAARGSEGSTRLTCWSWGDGPTVFLLHGWSGRAGQLGAFVEPLVSAGFSVVAFDAPAHGQSEGTRTSAPEFARALAAVVSRFGPAHAVIAHSMGGWAAASAVLSGARIDRVALLGSPTNPAAFTEQFSEMFGLTPAVIDAMMKRAERRTGISRAALDLAPRLAQAKARALIVHDETDEDVPVAEAERWARSWPGAEILRTEGLGHHKILRDPAVVARVLGFVGAAT